MDNDLHDIDKLFFNSLEPNEENPSKNVWEEINKRLDDEGRKKIGAAYLWIKRTLLILLFIGSGFWGYHITYQKNKTIRNANIATVKQKKS